MASKSPVWSWTARLAVLATVAGVAVSVIYLPQPLLTELGSSLGVSAGSASIVATTVQAGYAVGIFFFVPLADLVRPRRQISIQLVVLAATLLATAAAPGLVAVALGFVAVGLVANIAQLIIPTAGRLAPEDRKGSTTSGLVGALLIGIFGGRIAASVLGQLLGWRWVLVIFALLILLMLPLVRRALDGSLPPNAGTVSYGRLLGRTVARIASSPALRQSAVMQFFAFATFNSLWTVMVLHLTAAPFGWTVLQAGLFGFVGLVAGILTPFSGRFVDRFGATRVSGVLLVVLLMSAASIVIDARLIWLFGISVFLLTWANQSLQSANQSRVLQANADGGGQANTVFMVTVFLGGSFGAVVGPVAFGIGGMPATAAAGVVMLLVAGVIWILSARYERRRHRAPSPSIPDPTTVKEHL